MMTRFLYHLRLIVMPAFLFLTSCAASDMHRAPLHRGPLFRTCWNPALGGPFATLPPTENESPDIRRQVVAEARRIQQQNTTSPDFGASDIEKIFRSTHPGLNWKTADGLSALVDMAKKCGAYKEHARPSRGDIALFHNQQDSNRNNKADDRFTGAGIVLQRRGTRMEVLTRTGNGPRLVHLWPDQSRIHTLDNTVVNSFVRVPARSDPPDAEYLGGQLYAGFIDMVQIRQDCAR